MNALRVIQLRDQEHAKDAVRTENWCLLRLNLLLVMTKQCNITCENEPEGKMFTRKQNH